VGIPPPPPVVAPNLEALLKERRQDLIDRWTAMIGRETVGVPLSRTELVDHMPRFIDELTAALHPEALPLPQTSENAGEHGSQRLELGFNVGEVVREYGALHRCIIEIADESGLTITTHEQMIMARSLNSGIANAVSQYVAERDAELHRQMSEHLGFIAHEVRNPLSSAAMAFALLQKRELASGGRAVELLAKNLRQTSDVIDNALQHASLSMGVTPRREAVRVGQLLEEIVSDCAAEAQVKGIEVVVTVAPDLALDADPRLLRSAIANLVRNGLKFSRPGSELNVRARRKEDAGRVQIEVEDGCGGLPPGQVEELFRPLVRRGTDQSGFGLGLSIAHQAATAHNGTIAVRDLPGKGCVFTIDLPAPVGRDG
jgi:signal transduction histidine kinase